VKVSARIIFVSAILVMGLVVSADAQRKTKQKGAQPKTDTLATLRDEYIKATRDFQTHLQKLLALYEKSVSRAEAEHKKSESLFEQGLISRKELESSAMNVAAAKDKVSEVQQQMTTADTQIANTLLEADAEAKLARVGLQRGALVRTTSYIRFNGGGDWGLSDSWKIQRFFQDTFKKPLPIAVFGQGAIHDRWRLDHRNSIDVSVHPDGIEGQALMNFLRSNGIPFLAFRGAIPGTATGPHIHIGRPSHRY
jgi:hypothetical protein